MNLELTLDEVYLLVASLAVIREGQKREDGLADPSIQILIDKLEKKIRQETV